MATREELRVISWGDGEDKKSGTPEAPASILLWCMAQTERGGNITAMQWQARKAGNAVDVFNGLHLANACRLGSASIGARPGCIANEAAEVAVWLTAVTR
ncbi:hypothetical protein AnigIFM50267_000719 [Aspergillus niger]|nr:hypothetical protein AnigIFM50267_000719 [Aspergillus niger]